MQSASTPIVKDLVLAGGGHSHVTVLKKFAMKPVAGVRLTLICRDTHAPYSGMLPGFISGHYDFDDAHIDLGALARLAGARFYHAEINGLDLGAKRVQCRGRPSVPFDVLSINTGSAPLTADVPGADGNVDPVKPIDKFVDHWRNMQGRIGDGGARIGVVGGGAGGVELLLSVQHRLQGQGRDSEGLTFHLITDTDDILPTHNRFVRAKFERVLRERGVDVLTGHRVERVAPGRLFFAGGNELALDEILWVTAAGAPAWPGEAGLEVDARGFILVDDALRSPSHEDVFAAGDVASVVNHPRPKSGVFAVRQGPPLAANLRRHLLWGGQLNPSGPSGPSSASSPPAISMPWRPAPAGRWRDAGCGGGRTGSTAASCANSTSCRKCRWTTPRT